MLPREFAQPVDARETGGCAKAKLAPADVAMGPTVNGPGAIVLRALIDISVDRDIEQRRNPCAAICDDYLGCRPREWE
jgi:hypothetical protein